MIINIIRELLKYLRGYKLDLSIVIVALLCVSGSLLVLGYAFRQLVDNGLKANYLGAINQYILLICILIIVFGASSFLRSYFINNITEKIINQIRINAYSNLLSLDVVHFEELKIGDIISRLTADIELIAKLIIDFLSSFIRNSVMLIGGLVLMFIQSNKLSLIVVIAIPLLLIPLLKLGKYVRILSRTTGEIQSGIASTIEESFSNIRTIYAFNQQAQKVTDFNKQTENYLKYSSNRLKARSLFFALSMSAILFSITLVIWIGSTDIIKGTMSSGQMISFIYYAIIAGVSGAGVAELFSELQRPILAAERVFRLITLKNKTRIHQPPSNILTGRKTFTPHAISEKAQIVPLVIEAKNVSFSYPARPDTKVLDNISLKIALGKFIGIVGRSGVGKSTIMQLLLKFYYPNSGIITINDQDISTWQAEKVRSIIAYVPQDPSIFSGTIKSNIAISRPAADENEIVNIAKTLGIMDFASKLKDGLNTEIGEKGIRLSGGQKQRIAIARAILYKPQFLLLDEATSNLDSESEQQILFSIRQVMQNKTIISIAHRISSIEHADEILVIDKGNIITSGTHSELLAKSEVYRALCEEQLK
jgi:ATP-binding cassette subfamily B protein